MTKLARITLVHIGGGTKEVELLSVENGAALVWWPTAGPYALDLETGRMLERGCGQWQLPPEELERVRDVVRPKRIGPVAPTGQWYRASGEALCKTCWRFFREHPYDTTDLDAGDQPFLHVLCDGARVKL